MKNATVYEVGVYEWAYNGLRGAPAYYNITGPKARTRAIEFAKSEQTRSSVTSTQVLRMRSSQPTNRSIAFELYKSRNPNAVKP